MPENEKHRVQLEGRVWFFDGFYIQLPESEFTPEQDVLDAIEKLKSKKTPDERATITCFARAAYTGKLMQREKDLTMLRKPLQKQAIRLFQEWHNT